MANMYGSDKSTAMQEQMDEKHTDHRRHSLSWPSRHRPRTFRDRLVRHIIPSILLLSAVVFVFRHFFVSPQHHYDPAKGRLHDESRPGDWVMVDEAETKVALEAHIMSKCPDARDCLQQLIVPTMANVSDRVDFKLSYIGSVDPYSDELSCMHGPSECLGNIIQLCAATVYPDPKLYLGFANCMIADYPDIPERDLVEGCAMEHGLDFNELNECISDEGHGQELLRSSILRSKDHKVTKSCTVRLEGKVRCIRDGGEWYDCPGGSDVSDLVSEIKELHRRHQEGR